MALFGNPSSNSTTRGVASIGDFDFLERDSSKEAMSVKLQIDGWYRRFPRAGKPDVSARIRNADPVQHKSALLELATHETLHRLGYRVQVHPKLKSGKSTHPDFRVMAPLSQQCYVEATLAGSQTSGSQGERSRHVDLWRSLRQIHHPELCFYSRVLKTPANSPPLKRIKQFLENEMKKCQPSVKVASGSNNLSGGEIVTKFEGQDWEIDFTILPRQNLSGRVSSRKALLMQSYRAQFVPSVTKLQERISDKCSKYGDLELPFVIVLLDLDLGLDKDDLTQALLYPGGLWTDAGDPKNRRVSAIVIIQGLSFFNLESVRAFMMRNPIAHRRYNGRLAALPRFEIKGKDLFWKSGIDLSTLLSRKLKWWEKRAGITHKIASPVHWKWFAPEAFDECD